MKPCRTCGETKRYGDVLAVQLTLTTPEKGR